MSTELHARQREAAGPQGTGKKLVATAIHALRCGLQTPRLMVRCGEVPARISHIGLSHHDVVKHEEKIRRWREHFAGVVPLARGTTLVLENIDELRSDLQHDLAEAMEAYCIDLGEQGSPGSKVVATPREGPETLMADGRIVPELFYSVQTKLRLPALRQRPEDIPLLLTHFLDEFRKAEGKEGLSLTPEALQRVMESPLPGNVGQLRSLAAMVAGMFGGGEVTVGDVEGVLGFGGGVEGGALRFAAGAGVGAGWPWRHSSGSRCPTASSSTQSCSSYIIPFRPGTMRVGPARYNRQEIGP